MVFNKFKGLSARFKNGLAVGFNWVHSNGESSKTSALLASYHPPGQAAWRWAIYWYKPKSLLQKPTITNSKTNCYGRTSIHLPVVGGFSYAWQKYN